MKARMGRWRPSTQTNFFKVNKRTTEDSVFVLELKFEDGGKRYNQMIVASRDIEKVNDFGNYVFEAIENGYESTVRFFEDNGIKKNFLDSEEEFNKYYKSDDFNIYIIEDIYLLD